MVFCRSCGKQVDEKAEICVGCGVRPLNSNKFCQNCGGATNPEQELCVKCGVRLKKVGLLHVDTNKITYYVKSNAIKAFGTAKTFQRKTFVEIGLIVLFIVLNKIWPAFPSLIMIPLALVSIIMLNKRINLTLGMEKKFCQVGYWVIIVFIVMSAVGFAPRMDLSSERSSDTSMKKVMSRLKPEQAAPFGQAYMVFLIQERMLQARGLTWAAKIHRKTADEIIRDSE